MILDDRERAVVEMALRIAIDQSWTASNACVRRNDTATVKIFDKHITEYRAVLEKLADRMRA